MNGKIMNFRSSRTRQTDNQMIIIVEGCDSKDKAAKFVGQKVVFKTESGKEIIGKVSAAHGNSGAIRAIFERGMPGQSLTKDVLIE